MKKYELHWKCMPMKDRDSSSLKDCDSRQGVYMHVVHTTSGKYVGCYIGQSENLYARWGDRIKDHTNPDKGLYVPHSAEKFLADPVSVFNKEDWAPDPENLRREERCDIQKKILEKTDFCFAEIPTLQGEDTLEAIEYVLQHALKGLVGITEYKCIGDMKKGEPSNEIAVENHFDKSLLSATLPSLIEPVSG